MSWSLKEIYNQSLSCESLIPKEYSHCAITLSSHFKSTKLTTFTFPVFSV